MAATGNLERDVYARLGAFIESLKADIYPEPLMEPHRSIIPRMIDRLVQDGVLKPGRRVLDVGCGRGFALECFRAKGAVATGITLGSDYRACVEAGLDVREMDMAFLDFDAEEFDLVWCRHALEHSIFPLFALSEFRRLLVPRGYLYVEVPAPDTACHHENNPNHYSVFGSSMWASLFRKARFDTVFQQGISFEVPAGPDVYWAFLLRKSDH